MIQRLLNKRKIRCACLGTAFNLPMSTVTLVEDGVMVFSLAGEDNYVLLTVKRGGKMQSRSRA